MVPDPAWTNQFDILGCFNVDWYSVSPSNEMEELQSSNYWINSKSKDYQGVDNYILE